MQKLFQIGLVWLVLSSISHPIGAQTDTEWVTMGYLPLNIQESSGLAQSRIHKSVLWTLNDGGNSEELFALTNNGSYLGKVRVQGAINEDWEDLASFQIDGQAWLLIADTGDNQARRPYCTLYGILEPDMISSASPASGTVSVKWHIDFRYPKGPRDCEAVAVDVSSRQILLLTKRTVPPEVYTLPLKPGGPSIRTAKQVARLNGVSQNLFRRSSGYRPTAMDICSQRTAMSVLTYRCLWVFSMHRARSWSDVFVRIPRQVVQHSLNQAESLCFDSTGRWLYVTSENYPAPLMRLPLSGTCGIQR